MRPAAAVLAVFLLASIVAAQPKKKTPLPLDHAGCTTYFAVAWVDSSLPNGYVLQMSDKQLHWFRSKGMKKYATVCYWPPKAQYVIVWGTRKTTVLNTVPVIHSTETHSQTSVTGDVDGTVRDDSGNTSRINATINGDANTTSTTTWESTALVPQEVNYARAAVVPVDAWKSGTVSILYLTQMFERKGTQGHVPDEDPGAAVGSMIGGLIPRPAPDKQALESAVKFLAKEASGQIP